MLCMFHQHILPTFFRKWALVSGEALDCPISSVLTTVSKWQNSNLQWLKSDTHVIFARFLHTSVSTLRVCDWDFDSWMSIGPCKIVLELHCRVHPLSLTHGPDQPQGWAALPVSSRPFLLISGWVPPRFPCKFKSTLVYVLWKTWTDTFIILNSCMKIGIISFRMLRSTRYLRDHFISLNEVSRYVWLLR